MKKKKIIFLVLAAVILVMVSFIVFKVCAGKPVYEISLNERDVALEIGEKLQLHVVLDEEELQESQAEISWRTKKSSVATVDEEGVVTGVAGGESRITAILKHEGKEYTASCVVTVKGGDMEYSTYRLRYFTQRKDRNGYDVTEEVYDRIVGSKVSITNKEASKLLPSNYVLNTDKSILNGTVKEHKGGCVLEIYYDVAEVTYSVESYYESASKLGTYTEKETKKFKAYAFTTVELPEAKEGFKLNPNVKGSVLKKESVVAGNKLVAYYDRIESKVTVSYMSGKKDATYKVVYGVGLLDAPISALTDELAPYKVVSYVNGKKTTLNEDFIKKITSDIKVEFNVEKIGFTYVKGSGLLNNCNTKDTDSYVYLDGASSSIYLKATYDITGSTSNQFGITIRSGNTSREIRFENQGIKVTKDHSNKAGTLTGNASEYNAVADHGDVNIWAQKSGTKTNSVVSSMLKKRTESSHEIIWVIWEGTLYCSVDGQVAVRLPLNLLEESWGKNSKYEIGFSACDTEAVGDELIIRDVSAEYGKDAENKIITDKTLASTDVKKFYYEAVTGSYQPQSSAGGKYIYNSATKESQAVETTIRLVDKDNTGSSNGITAKWGNQSVQIAIAGFNESIKIVFNHDQGAGTLELPNNMKPYNEEGECKLTAVVKDEKLYIFCNDKQAGAIELNKIFKEYKSGDKIALGIYSWNANNGLAKFMNTSFIKGEKADEIPVEADKIWDFKFFTTEETNVNVDCATGTIANKGTTGGAAKVNFMDESDKWEVTGTMYVDEGVTTGQMRPQFFVTNGETTFSPALCYKGPWLVTTDWSYTGDNNSNSKNGRLVFNKDKTNTEAFANEKGHEQGYGRTKYEMDFKVVIADDVMYVWFESDTEQGKLIPTWRLPLTEPIYNTDGTSVLVNGFSPSNTPLEYTFGLGNMAYCPSGGYKNLNVKTGSDVDMKCLSDDWTFKFFTEKETNASVDSLNGTIANKGKQLAMRVDFMGESDRWEVTGTMYVDAGEKGRMLPQFFVMNGDKTFSPVVLYKGPQLGGSNDWNYTGGSTLNSKNGNLFFNVNNIKTELFTNYKLEGRSKEEMDFKVVIANDVMYVWLESNTAEGVLLPAWRLPLTTPIYDVNGTNELFSGFTSSNTPLKYAFGLGNTNETYDSGGYKNLTVKTGSDVDMKCISDDWTFRFLAEKESNASTDPLNGIIANKGSQSTVTRVDFMGESDKWEVTGTMYVDEGVTTGRMYPQFFVTNGSTTFSPNLCYKGFQIGSSDWNYTGGTDSNVTNGALTFNKTKTVTDKFVNQKPEEHGNARTKFEMDFKVVIANDVMYVWFESDTEEGVLIPSWRLPLTTPIYATNGTTPLFSGFTSSDLKYTFGLGNTAGCPSGGYKNLTVKTGSAVDMNCIWSSSEFLIKSGHSNYDVTNRGDGVAIMYTGTTAASMELFASVGENDDVYIETVLKKGTEFNAADYRYGFQFGDVCLDLATHTSRGLVLQIQGVGMDWTKWHTYTLSAAEKQAFTEGNGLKIAAARVGGKYYMYVERDGKMVPVLETANENFGDYAKSSFNIKLRTQPGAKGAVYSNLNWEIKPSSLQLSLYERLKAATSTIFTVNKNGRMKKLEN